ncbi:hypothetical protein K9M79_03005 [Candidatus Woesearchaeota archaeon]|nr:hypothetical protein [Candidatus Woesearchaeota archaeon]
MKKLLRKILGIEDDKKEIKKEFKILCQAIDETFNLKKQDNSISGRMLIIKVREIKDEM